ncbi:MAG: hypothetical protein NVS3B25_34100 [Hymenobacter sp.]
MHRVSHLPIFPAFMPTAMRLFSTLLLLWSLAGCAGSRPATTASPATPLDSLARRPGAVLTPAAPTRPGLLRRLFPPAPRWADTLRLPAGTRLVLPRKLRHSQLTVIIGDQNRVSQAQANKFKAPTVLASDSASLTDQAGATNAVAQRGSGNAASQTSTAPRAPGIGAVIAARLAGPLGVVLALVVVGAGLYLLGPWLLALLGRLRPGQK